MHKAEKPFRVFTLPLSVSKWKLTATLRRSKFMSVSVAGLQLQNPTASREREREEGKKERKKGKKGGERRKEREKEQVRGRTGQSG